MSLVFGLLVPGHEVLCSWIAGTGALAFMFLALGLHTSDRGMSVHVSCIARTGV